MRNIFDSNQISTGTVFLTELSKYITLHFTKEKRPYQVIIQDETIIGEGEHKIVRYLEKKQKKRSCIYSPDADLIMLGIGLHKKNIFILRPNIYCTYTLIYLPMWLFGNPYPMGYPMAIWLAGKNAIIWTFNHFQNFHQHFFHHMATFSSVSFEKSIGALGDGMLFKNSKTNLPYPPF